MKIFLDFLVRLKAKISFSSLSLQEGIESSRENSFAALVFSKTQLRSLPAAFRSAAAEFFVSPQNTETALSFFSEFGRSDLQNQLVNLEMYIGIFEKRIAEASEAFREKSKINVMLYSFIGVTVALLLI